MQIPSDFINFNTVKSDDIPEIQLYMDQVLDFFETKLGANKRTDQEPIFTKTMINNYVKANVVPSPVKKKYAKEAIMDLIMVYAFKQVLSLQDTKSLIKALNQIEAEPYNHFISTEEAILSALKADYIGNEIDSDETLIAQIVALTLEASIKKRLAEKLLDQLSNSDSK
ncbi:DUF1836 domain-containing protein [Fusibacter ferrireducens]|uniref:DUF1836 domain-containing protein n=1 Tax=Fusibacter ferrireducens TaxID=2785058 RepID=A0ABR9ZS71_9FIRM|nr:DUF1836 domain-containing protein [Fusibacter ferrireducens]MBF4693307.1 DUF1836 domain-containing protein [Fusibacter ferrireducens]